MGVRAQKRVRVSAPTAEQGYLPLRRRPRAGQARHASAAHHAFLHTITHSRPAQGRRRLSPGGKTGHGEKAASSTRPGPVIHPPHDPMPAPQRHASPNLISVSLQDKDTRSCMWMPGSSALTVIIYKSTSHQLCNFVVTDRPLSPPLFQAGTNRLGCSRKLKLPARSHTRRRGGVGSGNVGGWRSPPAPEPAL